MGAGALTRQVYWPAPDLMHELFIIDKDKQEYYYYQYYILLGVRL